MNSLKTWPVALALVCAATASDAADWRQFRGNDNNSVAPGARLPVKWSENENLAWKVDLPGRGPSSPIVVGDRVIVTCSSGPRQDRLYVICFDAKTGRQRWRRQFWATGRTFCHPTTANATPTPASDGQRIFAFYSSNDLVCLDLDGNFLWFRGLAHDYLEARNDVGMASSPVVVGDTVVVQVENHGDSFATGIDAATGHTRWRLARDQESSWSSPVVLRGAEAGKEAVLLQSQSGITVLDPQTGKQRWKYDVKCAGIPSSVVTSDKVFVPANGLTALRASADPKTDRFVWDSNRIRPGTASPVVHAGRVYVAGGGGILTCADAANGEILWKLRLQGPFWSTPVFAGTHLYVINGKGLAQVVKVGDQKGELIATSNFGETIQASPAVADGAYYVRSDKHLWKIASP